MDPQRIRELMADPRIKAIVDESPPPPKAAVELLRANGCPIFKRREQSEEAA